MAKQKNKAVAAQGEVAPEAEVTSANNDETKVPDNPELVVAVDDWQIGSPIKIIDSTETNRVNPFSPSVSCLVKSVQDNGAFKPEDKGYTVILEPQDEGKEFYLFPQSEIHIQVVKPEVIEYFKTGEAIRLIFSK